MDLAIVYRGKGAEREGRNWGGNGEVDSMLGLVCGREEPRWLAFRLWGMDIRVFGG